MSSANFPSSGICAKVAISQSNTPYDLRMSIIMVSDPWGWRMVVNSQKGLLRHCAGKAPPYTHQTSEAEVKIPYSRDSGAIHQMGSIVFVAMR